MVLPACCPHSVVVTMGNCRHKIKVLDVPLGVQWSQMTIEACIGVLGIQDTFHFTSRDMGYYVQFQG